MQFVRFMRSHPYERRVNTDSLVSATTAMDGSIGDLARDIDRVQQQLKKADAPESQERIWSLVRRITENTLKTRKWQLELKELAAESEREVDTISCSDLDDILREFETEKQMAMREAREDVRRCVICVSNDKNATLIPCSHTFCHECVM